MHSALRTTGSNQNMDPESNSSRPSPSSQEKTLQRPEGKMGETIQRAVQRQTKQTGLVNSCRWKRAIRNDEKKVVQIDIYNV